DAWLLAGNIALPPPTNFIGTLNNVPFLIVTNNNTTAGTRFSLKGQIEPLGTGQSVFVGEGAGAATSIGIANANTLIGFQAGLNNTTGSVNTAIGFQALQNNISSFNNTAVGSSSLADNITGNNNSAFGGSALTNNTIGIENTAAGSGSLFSNISGSNNTAV